MGRESRGRYFTLLSYIRRLTFARAGPFHGTAVMFINPCERSHDSQAPCRASVALLILWDSVCPWPRSTPIEGAIGGRGST